jgi:hypothetical protein
VKIYLQMQKPSKVQALSGSPVEWLGPDQRGLGGGQVTARAYHVHCFVTGLRVHLSQNAADVILHCEFCIGTCAVDAASCSLLKQTR